MAKSTPEMVREVFTWNEIIWIAQKGDYQHIINRLDCLRQNVRSIHLPSKSPQINTAIFFTNAKIELVSPLKSEGSQTKKHR